MSWDSLSREERVKNQGKTKTSETVTVNKRNSIEKYHAGKQVNAASISALAVETIPTMKCQLLVR